MADNNAEHRLGKLLPWLVLAAASLAAAASGGDTLEQARKLAFNHQRSEALEMLGRIVAADPDASDAQVFYGTVFSWEGRYEEARTQLEQVLARRRDHGDAILALLNVELWSDHPGRAESLAAGWLQQRPNTISVMLARSRALQALHREREAVEVLNRVLALEPGNPDAFDRRSGLRDGIRQWQAGVSQSHEWFDQGYGSWSELQFSARRLTGAGSVIARFSRAGRFSLSSQQAEVEFYPRIRRGTYGYLDVGYSPDARLYPRFRFGADLFQSLGRGFEGSGGMRRLVFTNRVNIYTASLAKYRGNWLFNTRVYLTPGTAGTSHSIHFSVRRYFGSGSEYIGVRVGRGNSPVETRTVADVGILNSTGLYGEINKSITRRWTLNVKSGLSQEDRLERSALRHYLLESNLYFRF